MKGMVPSSGRQGRQQNKVHYVPENDGHQGLEKIDEHK